MRLARHERALAALEPSARRSVVRYFVERGVLPGDVPGDTLVAAARLCGLCAADVILCLLRLGMVQAAEAAWGRSVRYLPPCVARARLPRPAPRVVRAGDERVVRAVRQPQPRENGRRRLVGAAMYARLAEVRPGMTVSAALARGVRRNDLRIALRRGYVELSVKQRGEDR